MWQRKLFMSRSWVNDSQHGAFSCPTSELFFRKNYLKSYIRNIEQLTFIVCLSLQNIQINRAGKKLRSLKVNPLGSEVSFIYPLALSVCLFVSYEGDGGPGRCYHRHTMLVYVLEILKRRSHLSPIYTLCWSHLHIYRLPFLSLIALYII